MTDLLSRIEQHLKDSKASPTAFGMEALGDPNFVFDLRKKGRDPRLSTAQRVLDFIQSNGSKASAPLSGGN